MRQNPTSERGGTIVRHGGSGVKETPFLTARDCAQLETGMGGHVEDPQSLTDTQKSNLRRLLRMEAFDQESGYRAGSYDGSSFASLKRRGLLDGTEGTAVKYWLNEEGRKVAEALKEEAEQGGTRE